MSPYASPPVARFVPREWYHDWRMRRIHVAELLRRDDDVEIVERKGIGHPDTICDAVAEALSVALSKHYLRACGAILHHNVDKALLVGGTAKPVFGGGEVTEPIEIHLAGRARLDAVPIVDLAERSARAWLAAHLHALDANEHVKVHCLVRESDPGLAHWVEHRAPLANDTSVGVGWAPLSPLESCVLTLSDYVAAMPARAPHVGEDVKIMAVREGERVRLTVACALVARHVASAKMFDDYKEQLHAAIVDEARRLLARDVDLALHPYLTVTGTSADSGDDGEVGRGNRTSGLITPGRPMTIEAAAGKNAVAHVGKLYAIAAREIAAEIVEGAAIPEAECMLVSEIGQPIDEPQIASLRLATRGDDVAKKRAEEIARAYLPRIPSLWERVIRGEIRLF